MFTSFKRERGENKKKQKKQVKRRRKEGNLVLFTLWIYLSSGRIKNKIITMNGLLLDKQEDPS
jgi:cell division protein FtsB